MCHNLQDSAIVHLLHLLIHIDSIMLRDINKADAFVRTDNITASWAMDDSKLTLNNITLNVDKVSCLTTFTAKFPIFWGLNGACKCLL